MPALAFASGLKMELIGLTLSFLGFLLLAGVAFAAYLGAFRKVEFRDDTLPAYDLYYVENVGPYREIGAAFSKVCAHIWCQFMGARRIDLQQNYITLAILLSLPYFFLFSLFSFFLYVCVCRS